MTSRVIVVATVVWLVGVAEARAQDDCAQNPYCAAVMLTEQIIQQYGLQTNPIQQGRAAAAAAEWYGIDTYSPSPLYWDQSVLPSTEEEFEEIITVTEPVCVQVEDGEIRCFDQTFQRKCATDQQMAGLRMMESKMSWLTWVYAAAAVAFPQFRVAMGLGVLITHGAELAAKQLRERADAGGC
jgi:hypothetical protein